MGNKEFNIWVWVWGWMFIIRGVENGKRAEREREREFILKFFVYIFNQFTCDMILLGQLAHVSGVNVFWTEGLKYKRNQMKRERIKTFKH